MAKPEKIVESLNKLYEKRIILDEKILETEKTLLSAVSVDPAAGKASGAKKNTARKGTSATKKPPAEK
jgi:hypothetical protein